MRRVAGKFSEHERKMAAAHLRHGRKFTQRNLVRELGFQTLDSVADPRWHARSTPGAAVLIAHRPQDLQRQGAGKWLEVERAVRTLFLRLLLPSA